MGAPQLRLFEIEQSPGQKLCPCCRKRYAPDGLVRCIECGGGKVKMCSLCGAKPIAKSGRKTCNECHKPYAHQDVFNGLPKEWIVKIESTVSGLRQRAKFMGHDQWPKRNDMAVLLRVQGFRCGLSGVELMPDKSTVLGHRKPSSRGGTFAIDNLFWITRRLNQMMGTMTEAEFRDACKRVASCI
jgi:hypothetical protein